MSGLVYFISYKDDRWRTILPYVKIGVSEVGLDKRLAQLQTGSPLPLTALGKIRTYAPYEAEHSFHQMFGRHCVGGEWFELNEGLLDYFRTHHNILHDVEPSLGTSEKYNNAINKLKDEITHLQGQIDYGDVAYNNWGQENANKLERAEKRIKELENQLKGARSEIDRLSRRLNTFGISTPSNPPKRKHKETPQLNRVKR